MDSVHARLLTLLELLQVYRRMSAREIAGRLEIDARTVRRYIAALQAMGIPVEGDRGAAGGYRLRPGFRLPPLMFTNDEALALVVGLLAAQRIGLLQAGAAVQGALAKLDRVLPDQLRGRVRAAHDRVAVGIAPARRPADPNVVLGLTAATADATAVRLRYRAAAGAHTERVVEPYGVGFQSGAWYLVGFDRLRSDLRTFRLDRVLRCEVTTDTFEPPAEFDVSGHLSQMLATRPWPHVAEVLLLASPAEVRRRVSPSVGTLEPDPEGVRFRVGADDPAWIASYLASLDLPFRLLGPPEVADALAALASRLRAAAAPAG